MKKVRIAGKGAKLAYCMGAFLFYNLMLRGLYLALRKLQIIARVSVEDCVCYLVLL